MRTTVHLLEIEKGDHYDGTFGDIALLSCPFGHRFKEDIKHCKKCDEDYMVFLGGWPFCPECHRSYELLKEDDHEITSCSPDKHDDCNQRR